MKHWPLLSGTLVLLALEAIGSPAQATPQRATSVPLSALSQPAETTTATATPTETQIAAATTTATPTGTQAATGTATASVTGSPTPDCTLTHWRQVTAPTSQGLAGVAAVSTNDVWAVGDDIYHWDGTGWQAVPHPSQTPTFFTSISAWAADDIWTVGNDNQSQYQYPAAVLHWDGFRWNSVTVTYPDTPKQVPYPTSQGYYAVTAAGVDTAYVARTSTTNGSGSSIVLRCNSQSCIFDGRPDTSISAMSALSAEDVWAVGGVSTDVAYTLHARAAHRTTAGWQMVTVPDIGNLTGVAVITATDVWAVSDDQRTGGGILHWDGTAWTQVPSPAGAAAVAGRTGNDVWAVGDVIQHWAGTAWRIVSSSSGRLTTVSPLTAADVWAVGALYATSNIQHYSPLPTFSDVPTGYVFAPAIEWLTCRALISGYTCGSPEPCDSYTRPYYRPAAGVSRGQVLKIITGAAGWSPVSLTNPTFADVPVGSTFAVAIETGVAHGIISGYTCGSSTAEPCDAQHRPYFRPGSPVSRGQLAKILALARDYHPPISGPPTFADVPATDTFYSAIEAVAAQNIVGGYNCGTLPSEPCDGNGRPYFRPTAGATRGQLAKFVSLAYGGPAR